MMSEDFFDNTLSKKNEDRPDFLKVLIVLTWIAVAVSVFSSFITIINSGDSADQIEESMAIFENVPADSPELISFMRDYKAFIEVSIENMIPLNLSILILYLFEGFAALMMFNLKKIGYWLYIVCQAGFIFAYFNFYPSDNLLTTISISSAVIFSTLFIILYGVNLKYLKN